MEALNEIIQFLDVNARLDLKQVSLTHVLSLTGSTEGLSLISSSDNLLTALLKLTNDASDVIAKDAALCLINISASENGAVSLMANCKYDLLDQGLKNILNKDSKLADPFCMILNNISRKQNQAQEIIDLLCKSSNVKKESDDIFLSNIEKLMRCYVDVNFNKYAKLHYLGSLFSNLTQCPMGREVFFQKNKFLLDMLLPFISFEHSHIRRGGAIGLLKNLCFDKSSHPMLLGQNSHIDILPYILLPLAGPEEFDDEENDKLPMQLQYLGPEKQREEDPTLRAMLLECLEQLCSTRNTRNILRNRGTYEILREYHKWETKQISSKIGDKKCLLACENVVDILIRTEEEIGTDDLKSLEVPTDLIEKFNDMDKQFLDD